LGTSAFHPIQPQSARAFDLAVQISERRPRYAFASPTGVEVGGVERDHRLFFRPHAQQARQGQHQQRDRPTRHRPIQSGCQI